MHLLVLIQEQFPQNMFTNVENRRSREIQKFLDYLCKKNYSATKYQPEWNKIRPREIKLFDFTIPEEIEKEVIQDLMEFEFATLGDKIKSAMENPLIKKLAKKFLGIEPIDRTGLVATHHKGNEYSCYLAILGKYPDQHDKTGQELL